MGAAYVQDLGHKEMDQMFMFSPQVQGLSMKGEATFGGFFRTWMDPLFLCKN